MPSVTFATPYLFYQDDPASRRGDFQPVRNSHVYIDVPGDAEGFVHHRTDANGRLSVVTGDKARGVKPAHILIRKEPYAIHYDDGALGAEEVKRLGAGGKAAKANIQERKARLRRGGPEVPQHYFTLPRKPFEIHVERLEVVFFAGHDAPGRDEKGDLVRPLPPGEAEVVEPLFREGTPLPLILSPEEKQLADRKPVKPRLTVKEIAFRGFPSDPKFLEHFGIGPEGYMKRLVATEIAEGLARAELGLDEDAHNYIRRRYERLETAIWQIDLDREYYLELYPAKGPADPRYGGKPPATYHRWEKDFYAKFWRQAPDGAPPPADLENNRRVRRIGEMVYKLGGAGLPILAKNVDAVVMKQLPDLRKTAEVAVHAAVETYLFMDALWPSDLLPISLKGKDGIEDTGPFVKDTLERVFAVTEKSTWKVAPGLLKAELDEWSARLRSSFSPEEEVVEVAERVFRATRDALDGLDRAVERAAGSWAAIEAGAGPKPDLKLVNALKLAYAELLPIDVVVGKVGCWTRQRMTRAFDDDREAWKMSREAADNASKNERADLASALQRWASVGERLAKLARDKALDLEKRWNDVRHALRAALDGANQGARCAEQVFRGELSVALWPEVVKHVAAAKKGMKDLAKACPTVTRREGAGANEGDPPEASFAHALYAMLTARAFNIRELKEMAHYD